MFPSALRRTSALQVAPLLLSILAVVLLCPARAEAQERSEVQERSCSLLAINDVSPASFELSPLLQAGGGFRSTPQDERALLSLAGGLEGTFGLAGVGSARQYGGPVEFRIGPWLGVETPLDGVRGEGGLALSLGQVQHARWGTFGLRLGGGHDFAERTHLVGVFTYGVRYVPHRVGPTRGVCDPPTPVPAFAFGSGARLFTALRKPVEVASGYELVFGIEFEPTFFLPPYSGSKWIGAHHPH